MFASWGPVADLFYGVLVLLLGNPKTYQPLTKETRKCFSSYRKITPGKTLTSMSYLHDCIEETLRMLPSNNTGLPRISPGAMVDGQFIPKRVSIDFRTIPSSHVSLLLLSYTHFEIFDIVIY